MDFYKVDLLKKTGGRPLNNLIHIHQDQLYSSKRVVTAAKKKDMMDLLPYIPPIHHPYYRNLPLEIATRSSTQNDEDRSSNDEMDYD